MKPDAAESMVTGTRTPLGGRKWASCILVTVNRSVCPGRGLEVSCFHMPSTVGKYPTHMFRVSAQASPHTPIAATDAVRRHHWALTQPSNATPTASTLNAIQTHSSTGPAFPATPIESMYQ